MPMEQTYVTSIEREYEAARARQRRARDERAAHLEATVPGFAELSSSLRRARAAVPAALLRSEAEAASCMERVHKLEEEMDALLQQNGHAREELALAYDCERCRDTGWVETGVLRERCPCFYQKKIRHAYAYSGISLLDTQTFDAFDPSVFPDDGTPASQRARMLRVRDLCRDYARACPDPKKPNLLVVGETGLGKTYLCHSIAKEVLDAGHTVLCLTAYKLFESLRETLFGRGTDTMMYDADLLIVDDLGTEPLFNGITIEAFFTLYNERLLKKKPIVTATNLDAEHLRERYGERLSSRMLSPDTTTLLRLHGKDVRLSIGKRNKLT